MGEWISIKDRLPEFEQDVWLRRSKKNGEPYRHGPIYAGFYGRFSIQDSESAFRYSIGTWGSPEYCLKKGVTHWMPRVNDCPPLFGSVHAESEVKSVKRESEARRCQVPDCHGSIIAKGMCSMHYQREYLAKRRAAISKQ